MFDRTCGWCNKSTDGNPYWVLKIGDRYVFQCYYCRGKELKEKKKKRKNKGDK